MSPTSSQAQSRWYLIPARVILVTFLLTLLAFAVSLLLGILGLIIAGGLHDVHPDLTVAYRRIALPAAGVVFALALVAMTAIEIRNFRQSRTLDRIARASRNP